MRDSTRKKVLGLLITNGRLSAPAAGAMLGLSGRTVRTAWLEARAQGLAHVAVWEMQHTRWTPIWEWGPGEDAIMPRRLPKVATGNRERPETVLRISTKELRRWLEKDHRLPAERALCPRPGDMPRLPYLRAPI